MAPDTRYRLIGIQGPEAGKIIEVEDPEAVIGRAPEVTILLSSPLISRYHAKISFQSADYILEDQGSANGTFLNGERLFSRQPLHHGDRITFGENVVFEFQLVQAPGVNKDTLVLSDALMQDVPISPAPVEGESGPRTQAGASLPPTLAYLEGIERVPVSKTPPQILVIIAGEPPLAYDLVDPSITLGREDDNQIVVRSNIISRHHARFDKIQAGYRLVVTPGNTNETYVDGRRVSQQIDLMQNSLIRIGSADAGKLVTIQYNPSQRSESTRARAIQFAAQTKFLIGRDPANDIVLEAPTISRFHAEIEKVGQRYRVRDQRSLNGTFVNDQRVEGEFWAKAQDKVRIGPYLFVLGEDHVAQIDQTGGLEVDVIGLQKWVRKDLNLLQDISLLLKPCEFVVVVGQSGGGKTTLVDAIAGYRPATQGRVYMNGTDVYKHFDAVRSNIGYVPQRDIIHMELTVYESLDYAARLRMPPDTSPEERRTRIMEVLDNLDLTHRKDVQISGLSGGQQKRVSIGVELLTKPGLFLLDEPTSGLDPGNETSLMQLMRRLADQGRTIVLITHATKNVMLADKVIFLARGGHLAWFGPPDEALAYFAGYQSERERRYSEMDFDHIYAILEDTSKGAPEEWQMRFRQHPAYQKYILDPMRQKGYDLLAPKKTGAKRAATMPSSAGAQSHPFDPFRSLRQFIILSQRNLKILSRDRISLFLMLAAAPLVGCLDFILASGMDHNPYDYVLGDFSPIAISLFLFSIYGVMVGGLSQMREIVKEKAVYRRERLVNLQILPYVLSKMWVAGLLALYHALAYTVLHYLAFEMPGGTLEFFLIYVTVILSTFAGMMIGLFASALSPNANTAPMIVILLMIPQIVISGALIPLPGAVTAITSTRWAFQAFMGIAGIGSDLAADPCWSLPQETRLSMTLDEKNNLGCLCLGINVMRQKSCDFPGLGGLYNPSIDQPEPVKPAAVGDPPHAPAMPAAPPEPSNPNDPTAMSAYLQAMKAYQQEVADLQSRYQENMSAYQEQAKQYEEKLVQYQQDLASWQINRNEAISQAEAMLWRFDHLFGWATVDKSDPAKFTGMLVKTWSAQVIITAILFAFILILMKTKDRAQ